VERRYRIAFWLLMGVSALLLLVRTGCYPLSDPDESRFARTTIEMQREGEVVLPLFEGRPRLVKPPLVHWIQMPLFSLFGVSGWTARIHAALATLGSIFLVGLVTRRRFGEEGAFWAAAVMATTPLVVVLGRIGNLDALLSVHILAVIALDIRGADEPARGRDWILGVLLGLAFLAKGPVGVIVPLIVMLAGRTATGRDLLPGRGSFLAALGGWSLIVLPWGLAFLREVGAGAVLRLFREELLDRYVAGTSHVEPSWFYLAVLGVGFFPWQTPLLVGLVRLVRLRGRPEASTAAYAAAGLVAGLAFFSLGAGKLPSYILPLAPLVAVIVAWELGQELRDLRRGTIGPLLLSLSLGVWAVGLGIAGWRFLEGEPRRAALIGAAVYGLGTLASLPGVAARRPRRVWCAAALTAVLFLFAGLWILTPYLLVHRSAAALIDGVPELRSPRPVVVVAIRLSSLTLYLDRVPERILPEEIERRIDRDDEPVFVLARPDLSAIPPAVLDRLREIGGHGKLVALEEKQAIRGP
jgi:4-amino-4-deoxy-L-arabinose transferase-like glycosyltransferase